MSQQEPIRNELLTWDDVDQLVDVLIPQLRTAGYYDSIILITRGGIVPGGLVAEALNISEVLTASVEFTDTPSVKKEMRSWPTFLQFPERDLLVGKRVLTVDDVWGSGRTSTAVKSRCEAHGATAFTCVFHFNPYRSLFVKAEPDYYGAVTDAHIVYPWETDRGLRGISAFTPDPIVSPEAN